LSGEDSSRFAELAADITDPAQVAVALNQLTSELGAPSACLNCAGIYPYSTLESMDLELYRRVFDLNVLGTLLVAQGFIRVADPGRLRTIVNIASLDAFEAPATQLLYSGSKAAVVALTKSMASDLGAQGVRVTAIAPGDVDTETLRAKVGAGTTPRLLPSQIADLVSMLLTSPEAAGNGQTIIADAGDLGDARWRGETAR